MADSKPKGSATKTVKSKNLFTPVGTSGLPRYAGYIFDEWLPELQGPRGRKTLREMQDNGAAIGAMLFAIEMMIRQVSWTVARGIDTDEGHNAAEFIFQALHDMETPWEDTLGDITSMFPYGWSLFEQVYKIRDGKSSKYDDRKIGWQGWQMRGQETLLHWEYPDFHANYPTAFIQLGPPDFIEHRIPMDKCLLFRTTTRRANPEGRSLLRNAYHSWYMAKHLEAVESIGAERDMAGLPVGKVPSNILAPDASDDEKAVAQAWRDLVTNIRRDEQEGVLIPSDRDDLGNPEWELTLLSTGGQRQFNLGDVIERYEQRQLMTLLADFIMLGHTNVGTQSLGKTKIELFNTAISAYLSVIAGQINDVAIPRLLKLNGMDTENPPTLQHGQVERMDLDILGNYIYQLGQAGFILDTDPHGALQAHLLEQAHLPPTPDALENPFPDQWADLMPNPQGMNPSMGNRMPQPLGSIPTPGPGQVKEVVQIKGDLPGSNPPDAGGQQQQLVSSAGPQRPKLQGKARPSMKVPNQPNAPKAEPGHVARGTKAANGVLAKKQKASRRATESVSFEDAKIIAKYMSEAAKGDLKVVAFDLDNTALRFPEVFVPMATMFAESGVTVGVLTGNGTATAHEMWSELGYPEASFYLVHPTGDQETTAQWKAQQCKNLGVDLIIDDFSGGRNIGIFRHFAEQLGASVVALEVAQPSGSEHQHVGYGDSD